MKKELDAKGGMVAVMLRVEDTATALKGLESVLDSQARSQARKSEEMQGESALNSADCGSAIRANGSDEGNSRRTARIDTGTAESDEAAETTRAYRLP